MLINELRVYAEVLEQGLDFRDYLKSSGFRGPIKNCYTKKLRDEFGDQDSLVDRIRKSKDVDVLISAISSDKEYPILMIEYSTAVPTDDHKMQRADVYYWSSVYHCPLMKISPSTKGMNQDFGGGSRFTDEYEQAVSYKKGAVFFPVKWDCVDGNDTLPTKKNACSCMEYSDQIASVINIVLATFLKAGSFSEYFALLRAFYKTKYGSIINSFSQDDLKKVIVNSTRFCWQREKVKVKINRFGHAMDPDRGVLFFVNMLVGADNVITEIQVNRSSDYNARGGYKSLFDALSVEEKLKNYVEKIINNKKNVFSPVDALYVFITALNLDDLVYTQLSATEYRIEDVSLIQFLKTHATMVSKSIFLLSTELQLTDKDRNIICRIKWNKKPIDDYLGILGNTTFRVTPLKQLSIDEAKEDIITYASVELYKKMYCDLLAVSYPGAQGDRCILTGSGRKVLRTYIDIIAYKDDNGRYRVFLQENKDNISKSNPDVEKLKKIITDPEYKKGLKTLFRKTLNNDNLDSIFISIGAKIAYPVPRLDVDYIFMFDIVNSNSGSTKIDYSVALINMKLIDDFKPLMDNNSRLKGSITIDQLFIIDSDAYTYGSVLKHNRMYDRTLPHVEKVAEEIRRYTARSKNSTSELYNPKGNGSNELIKNATNESKKINMRNNTVPINDSPNEIKCGSVIKHSKYGVGEVINVVDDKLEVIFDCGVKSLATSIVLSKGIVTIVKA